MHMQKVDPSLQRHQIYKTSYLHPQPSHKKHPSHKCLMAKGEKRRTSETTESCLDPRERQQLAKGENTATSSLPEKTGVGNEMQVDGEFFLMICCFNVGYSQ